MQNIGFSNSDYVIKPLQPSSAIYGAPSFTGHLDLMVVESKCLNDHIWCSFWKD